MVGVVRGLIRWAFVVEPSPHWRDMFIAVSTALIWVPVVLAVEFVWRRTSPGWRLALANGALCTAAAVAEPLLRFSWRPSAIRATIPLQSPIVAWLDINILFYVSIVAATWLRSRRRQQVATELAASRVTRALADAQLHILTLQLHPHFLFNTLNLISQLAYDSASEALRMLDNLYRLLPLSLRAVNSPQVSLRDELGFLEAYVAIQRARFRERLNISLDVAHDALNATVPHLLLQPLVENAIVHGADLRETPGFIRLRASVTEGRLHISVCDDGPGPGPTRSEGLGLMNTRLRLEQMFGTDYSLTLRSGERSGSIVAIDAPLVAVQTADASGVSVPTAAPADAAGEDESPSAGEIGHRRRSLLLQVLAGWALVAAMWTELESLANTNGATPFDWNGAALSSVTNVLLWLPLTMLVVFFAHRFRPPRVAGLRRFAIHSLLGLGVALTHTAAWLLILAAVRPAAYHKHLYESVDWLMWDVVAYVAIVALATAVSINTQRASTRVEISAKLAMLARARLASMRLRLQPGILLRGFNAIADTIDTNPVRSEIALTRMGDLLRALLQGADLEYRSVREEVSLLRAFLEVIGAPEAHGAVVLDVDWPELLMDSVDIPALALVSIAAATVGRISRVHIDRSNGALRTRVFFTDGQVERTQLVDLGSRLSALAIHEHAITEHATLTGSMIELRLLVTEDDSAVCELPALVSA